jgi:hypothetical protein
MSLIGDYLLQTQPTVCFFHVFDATIWQNQIVKSFLLQFVSEEMRLNYEKNVQDCIASFPQLAIGLNVNVRFTSYISISFDFHFLFSCIFVFFESNPTCIWVVLPILSSQKSVSFSICWVSN